MKTAPNHDVATPIALANPAAHRRAWLRPGTPLEVGGVYPDLAAPAGTPFVPLPGQVAGSGNRYLARRDVTAVRWNRLVEGTDTDGQGLS